MSSLLLVNALDASRALGPRLADASAGSVEHFFMTEYLPKRGGAFNHDTSIFATGDLFRGKIKTSEAVRYCLTNGSRAGRQQNAEIVGLVGPHAELHRSMVHKVGFLAIAVGRHKGRTLFLGVKAPFVRVERQGDGYLVIPGYRKTYVPSDEQIGVPIALAHHQIAKDDLAGVDTEYLYAGPDLGGRDRTFRAITGSARSLLLPDQIDDLLAVYVAGIAKILDRGLGLGAARFAGYRIIDPTQGRMF